MPHSYSNTAALTMVLRRGAAILGVFIERLFS